MTNDRMKEEAIKAFDDPANMNNSKKVYEILAKVEYAIQTAAASKKTVNEVTVNAVAEDYGVEEEDEEEITVAATKKKQAAAKLEKKNKKNKKKTAAVNTPADVQAVRPQRREQGQRRSGPCSYCHKDNHTENRCYKRLDDLVARQSGKVNAVMPAEPVIHANVSSHMSVDRNVVAPVVDQPSLNSNGFW
jgi:cytochrome c2